MDPAVLAVHRGVHVFGVPEQLVTPAASNAYRVWPDMAAVSMNTLPSATAGDPSEFAFVVPDHSGAHDELPQPAGSNARRPAAFVPRYRVPPAMVGLPFTNPTPVCPVHKGEHGFEHVAGKEYRELPPT